jgi:hypothetical protein
MADKVTMKALDTMHMSNVHADNLNAGDVFQVNEADAKILEHRGLAERGGKAADAVNSEERVAARPETRAEIDAERGGKEASAPENKMVAASENKTVSARAAVKPTRAAAKRK